MRNWKVIKSQIFAKKKHIESTFQFRKLGFMNMKTPKHWDLQGSLRLTEQKK